MSARDISTEIQSEIETLIRKKQPINIRAGNSKQFYGRTAAGTDLSVAGHNGIIHYEPTELVITARCGTRLTEIESVLNDNNQMLGFEPPHFHDNATLGGTVATGLAGPRRPFSGAVRDFVLGTTIINGKAEILHFGGEVMKNVAGYDISRFMAGSMGTLGVILDVSLKVLPKPNTETTLSFELTEPAAINRINKLRGQAFPISAACFDGERLYIRLSGNASGVTAAKKQLGGEEINNSELFWLKIREQTHSFFQTENPLWRISLAPATPPLTLDGKQFIDWGGAQRWWITKTDPDSIYKKAEDLGGHATLFKNGNHQQDVFQPLHGKLRELHMNLKLAFDPYGLFNPGRMYLDF